MKILITQNITKQMHQQRVDDFERYLQNKYPIRLMLVYFDEQKYDYPTIEISNLIVKHRNQGIGSKVMQEIINYADKNKYDLVLNATDAYGSNVEKLKKFYNKFGFVENIGKNHNPKFKHNKIRKNR